MRYSRQEILKEIGAENQKKLLASKVVIVGLGATGSSSAELLARAGIGHLVLIDRDVVELSNLQRQSLFSEEDIGKPKAVAARDAIHAINSEVKADAYPVDLECDKVSVLEADLILDCTDNLFTRFLINDYCKKNKKPWIYSAVVGTKGMVMNFLPASKVCFNCIFKMVEGLDTCATMGILNTAPSVISSFQVTEAIKFLTGQKASKDLVHIDVWKQAFEKIKVSADKKCPVCKGNYEYLEGKNQEIIKFCGSGTYQIKGKFDYEELKRKLSMVGKVQDAGVCFRFSAMTIFPDRVIIKAQTEEEAKVMYSQVVGN
ncbi:MAG: HesA/MoeB/ThiF family protein [Candidatus Nanoarchaeia archaeon]|nr:HesA/MoeB/ThiF family protein [Candidatus Nanoarchaeia archaeon]